MGKSLLYLMRYPLDSGFDLKTKFDGQISSFRNIGIDVFFIGFDREKLYLIGKDTIIELGNTHFSVPSYIHTLFYRDLHKAAIKALQYIRFDYLYWRLAPAWYSSYKVTKKYFSNNTCIIAEIPTFPPSRDKQLSKLRALYVKYSVIWERKMIPLYTTYAVIGENANGEYNDRPAINIENGIFLDGIKKRTPKYEHDEIHILAMASMRYYHGYDRLIKSLGRYRGQKKVTIHMVGALNGECIEEWKKLAHDLNLDKQVIFHGGMYGEELDKMVDKCDLGCAALGIYRKNFSYISELKTREYTARCLPFILSAEDVIINPQAAYTKRLISDVPKIYEKWDLDTVVN